jgi:cell filamentation protein
VFDEMTAAKQFRDLDADEFAKAAAHFLAQLNAIHPFREGNGRTQLTFLKLIASAAGHSIDFTSLDAPALLAAMIASFHGNEAQLRVQIRSLLPQP